MNPSKDQATGVAERIIYGLAMGVLMKLVAAGYLDADMAPYVAGGIVTLVGGVWAWWINRPKALLQSAASVPGTTVVTTPDLAKATPNEANIVSNTNNKVVAQ